ncbi:MAG: hypothetical protein ACT4OJ_16030 [Bacteroidota bacterium]
MIISYKGWKNLFLFCLGLFAGTAFCMKWMERDFIHNGSLFTIIGLEISYPKEQVASILSGLDGQVKTILRYHLSFDFAFMLAVYPGIAALCMMAREKAGSKIVRQVLYWLAFSQIIAFACDVYENCCLLRWIKEPQSITGFSFYHLAVMVKWGLALAAALLAIPLSFRKRRMDSQPL